jgi:hypothetical protein
MTDGVVLRMSRTRNSQPAVRVRERYARQSKTCVHFRDDETRSYMKLQPRSTPERSAAFRGCRQYRRRDLNLRASALGRGRVKTPRYRPVAEPRVHGNRNRCILAAATTVWLAIS